MRKNIFAVCAVASACAVLVGCGGGSGAGDTIGGGGSIQPGLTIAVESAPPAAMTFAGGDIVAVSAVIGTYKTTISDMAWSAVPTTAGAPALVLANANCASALKKDVAGVSGFSSSVWDCATTAPAPLLSQPVSYKLTVTGKDADGFAASASTVVTIAPPGAEAQAALKPIVALPDSVEVTSGAPAAITCYGAPGLASLSKTITYAWRIKSNPGALAISLAGIDKSTVEFSAPTVQAGKPGQLTLECVASDSTGASTASEVIVRVMPEADSGGTPTADSTGSINMYPGIESQLSCFGSGGYTTAAKKLTYQWVIKSNSSGIIMDLAGDDTATLRVKPGTFPSSNAFETVVLQCRVTDAANKTGTVDVSVKVNRPATVNVPTNTAIANAGTSQSVQVGQLVTLNGSGTRISGSGTGEIFYAWTQVSGPAVSLSGINTATPSFRAPSVVSATTLRFMLTASTQGIFAGYVPKNGEISFVDVYVGATLAPRITLPTVTQAAPGTPTSLTATVEGNPEGKPVYYRWTQVSGSSVVIQTPNTASISFFAPAANGDLIFRVQASFDPAFPSSSTTSADALFRVATPPPAAL